MKSDKQSNAVEIIQPTAVVDWPDPLKKAWQNAISKGSLPLENESRRGAVILASYWVGLTERIKMDVNAEISSSLYPAISELLCKIYDTDDKNAAVDELLALLQILEFQRAASSLKLVHRNQAAHNAEDNTSEPNRSEAG